MKVQTRVTLNNLNLNSTMYTNSLIDILILFFFFLEMCVFVNSIHWQEGKYDLIFIKE